MHGHREVCGCGKRLTSQQVRITSVLQYAVILLGHSWSYQVKEQLVELQFRAEDATSSQVAQSAKQQTRSTTRPSAGNTVLRGD